MSADEAVKQLATSREKGLDAAEASTRLSKYGPNRLPEGTRSEVRSCGSSPGSTTGAKLVLSRWADAARQE